MTTERIKLMVISDTHRSTTSENEGMQTYGDYPGYRIIHNESSAVSIAAAVAQSNADSCDAAIFNGDILASVSDDAAMVLNAQSLVTLLAGLTAPFYFTLGHHDLTGTDGVGTAAQFTRIFDNTDGLGSLIPGGDDAPELHWWHDNAANDSPCAYSVTIKEYKLIFLFNTYAGIGTMETTGKSDDEGDNTAITQLNWLIYRLAEAEAASQQVIIFTHWNVKSNYDATYTKSTGTVPGSAATITQLEAQTIPPIIFGGHVHGDDEVIILNNVMYVNIQGDVYGTEEGDTDRFSHSIVEVIPGAVVSGSTKVANVAITGYGYQSSKSFTGYGVF